MATTVWMIITLFIAVPTGQDNDWKDTKFGAVQLYTTQFASRSECEAELVQLFHAEEVEGVELQKGPAGEMVLFVPGEFDEVIISHRSEMCAEIKL
jgi:hypothetical protein